MGTARKKMSKQHATKEEAVLLCRFRIIARKVVLMCRVCMRLRAVSTTFMHVWATLTKYATKTQTEEEQREVSKAAFDLQYFKIQHNNLSNREIQITMKAPEQRTTEELELLLVVLRSLLSFRHYSKPYQLLLAKIMRYERFRRRRMITRKGDPAHSFYFIYSGGVSFTTDQDGSSAFKEEQPADIRKGASFGEIPVLKRLRRNFTAVCVEDTELLVVDREDFFANKLDQVLAEEAHRRFIFFRSLSLLQSLPDSSIEVLSDHSTTEEFLYGQVIPHNIDNLIFVIKGRFVILRLVDLSQCISYHRFIDREFPFIKSTHKGMESIATFKIDKGLLNLTSRRASLYRHQKQLPNLSNKGDLSKTFRQSHPGNKKKDGEDPWLSNSSVMQDSTPFRSTPNIMMKQWNPQNMGSFSLEDTAVRAGMYSPFGSSAISLHSEDIPWTSRKLSEQFSTTHLSQLPKALAVAVYMQIDSILPGDVFGLHQYFKPNNLKDKRTFNIKSVGTKVVRIDMETFAKIADHKTLQKVRNLQSVYPSDNKLCEIFIRNNFWKTFKKEMIAKITSSSRRRSTVGKAPLSGQGEAMYEIDKTGLLNLPEIATNPYSVFSKPSYYVTPVQRDLMLPEIDLQLIHGVEKIPSNLKHALF
ncbi:cyclic nucleotide-binding domain-containing protein 2-like isoform X1 [Hemitrygon akajei]|uniref:cyclic nucleotide-binding domain-containing protein 2-like isoform X1 n=2 Tax=Hemitrygon akajei TaxID=2704970 RepID=UPI003BF9DAF9